MGAIFNIDKEKREKDRLTTRAILHYELFDPTVILRETSEIVDISESGLRFIAFNKLKQNDLLNLHFSSPDGQCIVKTRARVIRCKTSENHASDLVRYQIGVIFLDTPQTDRIKIKNLVENAMNNVNCRNSSNSIKWWQFWRTN